MNDRGLPRLSALTGLLFFVLLVVSGVIAGNHLNDRSSGAAILDWFKTHRGAAETSSGLIALTVVVGLVFYSSLRAHLVADGEDGTIARVGFAGVIIFAVSGAAGSGLTYATAHAVTGLDATAVKSLYVAQYATSMVSSAGIAALGLAMGLLIVRTARLPRWIGWIAMLSGVVALVPPINMIAFFATGLWTLVASIALYVRLGASAEVRSAPTVVVPA